MRVIDSSVAVAALIDGSEKGAVARQRLRSYAGHAPELVDLEVASALRGRILGRRLTADMAATAVDDLAALPIVRHRHATLLPRIWELRHNLTPYDAAYVALAEMLRAPLVTRDARLAHATGVGCDIELLA